ncbi:Anaphase-promoting complex subunit 8 [Leucoagaricus gongylophorus]
MDHRKALFLSRLSRREEAIECALLSIVGFPWNWSCWTLLGSCIGDGEELSSLLQLIPLPPSHPLVHMFQIKTLSELHQPTENELALCDRLLSRDLFPGSAWLMSLRACVLYHLHDFGQAEQQFEKILTIDPCRIDDIDIYSNILYVTDNRLKLSRLAHEFLALEKDRPEICCLVGNHYSLRAEHEKAVRYFRRATQLDRTYLSAWTLMGHEYVEMKNSHAAIEAYRRAVVDVNRKDYRAWYGLGQAYELLSMHHYSLYYYQRATALRPYDIRLWQAQGSCYEEIDRRREAIECYKRALIPADPHEISINLKLANLYWSIDDFAEAVAYHRRVVEVCQADLRPIQEYAKSCLQVAEYQMKIPDGDLDLAKEYLERVATSNAEDVVRATELLKEVKSDFQARSQNAETVSGGQVATQLLQKTD